MRLRRDVLGLLIMAATVVPTNSQAPTKDTALVTIDPTQFSTLTAFQVTAAEGNACTKIYETQLKFNINLSPFD